ncbi:MAG: toll/interleukin-1 receptor domain-containing protein [Leptolyngbyaceae cyanobacterium SM2_5_2]|nr:toll/interleukin-1 receptor domain-containing protein [Leptolyngbyaceae cyanobacterium SM2_5_2]
MMPSEVFLSHSSQDQAFVSKLADQLRRHGIPVWYSKTSILGAQQWHDEIGSALIRCDWFLVALSPGAVESMWVKRELIFALQQKRFENKIIPILYESLGLCWWWRGWAKPPDLPHCQPGADPGRVHRRGD